MDFFWHEHKVHQKLDYSYDYCDGCHEKFRDSTKWIKVYRCYECKVKWHTCCVPSSPEDIEHPCHPKHPLELLLKGSPTYSHGKCNLCQQKLSNSVYHCKLCDFSIDVNCANRPPPLIVDHPKCHEHALTLMVKDVSFICNACGTHGEGSPYVCLPCSFMFHYDCVDRPHIININRHEHRISHVSHFSLGNGVCEICRQNINWRYGAYSCNKCPNYFVHSRCATRKDVWDGKELKDIPEEEVDIAPFRVIEEGVINHFSHEEHSLFLIEDVLIEGGEDIHCEGCCRPISFDKYYKCMECEFMLHEDCANLPLQKRHALSTEILSLSAGKKEDARIYGMEGYNRIFMCVACGRSGNGFRYKGELGARVILDGHCASLFWFRHRKLHPHTLFLTTLHRGDCIACEATDNFVLDCTECEYSLCFNCSTLPVVTKHRCDDHYLFLSSGEKATGKYWCEICEAEITNPEKWLYTCHDCGVVCHIDCVVGDSLNTKPGFLLESQETKIEAVLNDHNSRPLCAGCGSRCMYPMFYKVSYNGIEVNVCSYYCSNKHKMALDSL